MQYAQLGTDGPNVSRLCLGTMTFGFQSDETVSRKILDVASDAGITFIDTADVYPAGGGYASVGRTEEIVGRWLSGKRDRFVVATKAGGPMGPSPSSGGASRCYLLTAIDGSLRRLRTDYVDLFQLHYDDKNTSLDETLDALHSIVRSGKARYVGLSNFMAYRAARALGRVEVHQLVKPVSIQSRYNLLFREIEHELMPLASEEGLGVMVYNPLAGGMLSGKYTPHSEPLPGTRFTLGTTGINHQKRYWHARQFEAVESLRSISDEAAQPLASLAVAWLLANPCITSVIIGASSPEQLADTTAAVDMKLDTDTKQQLDDLTTKFRSYSTSS